MRIDDYFSRFNGTLRAVLPSQKLRQPNPTLIGNVSVRFLTQSKDFIPEGKVFTLKDARLIGADGWVIGKRDTYLVDASFWGEAVLSGKPFEHPILRRHRPRPFRYLPGRTLSLASDFAVGGFGHFLHDSLTRLLLIQLAGYSLQDFDWVYLPRLRSPATDQLTAQLGIKPERLLNFDPLHDLQCEELTATNFPGRPCHIAPSYVEFIRTRFGPVPKKRDRRIHLSRTGARRNYANPKEILPLLEKYGFEDVVPDRDPEIFQKCAEAEFIVSIEGANFINAVFSPSVTRALIIFPDRGVDAPYALTLSESCGMTTFAICGETIGPDSVDGGIANFHLDPSKFESALQLLLNPKANPQHSTSAPAL